MHHIQVPGASCAALLALAGVSALATPQQDTVLGRHFQFAPHGLSATSSTNSGLVVEVSTSGLGIRPTAGDWTFALYAYDVAPYGEAVESPAGAPRMDIDGVLVRREGFVERVRATDDELQLGWTLDAPVTSRGLVVDDVWIGLRARGLTPLIDADGHGARLIASDGVAHLSMNSMQAVDATGRRLETRLVDGRDGLGVRIDATNAVFPVTLEPSISPAEPAPHRAAVETGVADLVLKSSTGGALSSKTIEQVEPDGSITLRVESPSGRHDGAIGVLLFQGFEQDVATVLDDGGLAVDPRAPGNLVETFEISTGGTQWTMPLPAQAGAASASLVFQGFAASSNTSNGLPPSTNAIGVRVRQTRVHVSSSLGVPGASGTASAPVATIEEGVALAASLWSPASGYPEVLIEGGTYVENLDIDVPVSVRGCLDATTWTEDPLQPTIVDAAYFGTKIRNITSPARIESIEFRSGDAPGVNTVGNAALSRALLVRDCSTALTFHDCEFVSGAGGSGHDGDTPGSIPLPTPNGQPGDDADPVPYTEKEGGLGGIGSLPGVREVMHGGFGGNGTVLTNGNDGARPFFLTYLNGIPWVQQQNCASPGQGGGVFGTVANKSGDPGGFGSSGASGAGGSAAQYRGIELGDGSWRSGIGSGGETGGPGCGGGGGGAGSGLIWSTPFPPFYYEWKGAGGGGGGAGGRGGGPGTPGTNGGASFGVQLIDASPLFTACTFAPGLGGEGGDGGQGHLGGAGGIGGQGGDPFSGTFGAFGASFVLGLGAGGNGGFGGVGGHGGGGSGGHGGPSSGVYAGGSSAPPALLSNNTFIIGSGGAAGSGGHNADDGTVGPSEAIWM